MPPSTPLDRRDAWCMLLLVALLCLLVARTFDFGAPPYEDAAILMRYSEHLAQGAGIVWNPGEQPVDGATDFLFMVALAGVRRLGLSIEDAARWLGIVSHALTCLVVYAGVRRLHAAPRWAALLSAAYLACGPGLAYAEAGFGTALATVFLLSLSHARSSFHPSLSHRWGTLDVARILADYPGDHTVAVTNAGQLPLYSRWRAIDVWGLNDHEIASSGLTEELLDRHRPEVIQFDAGFTPLTEGRRETPLPWHKAMLTLRAYAERRGYVLAACFGRSPFGGHYYYVRPDFPESAEIVHRIRELDYFLVGGRCYDFGTLASGQRGPG